MLLVVPCIAMLINADFSRRAIVHAARLDWAPSPMAGVERRMLDRIGDEVARATSIVRYAAGSSFSAHTHHGGEEFLVLQGIFQDEQGDFPAGSYVRNPPTSRHTPRSEAGCVLLVKLHQFDPDDRTRVRLDTDKMEGLADADRLGVSVTPLFSGARETVTIETIAPRTSFEAGNRGGYEMLVIEGELDGMGEVFETQSWVRLPPNDRVRLAAGAQGARIWVKTGHLRDAVRYLQTR